MGKIINIIGVSWERKLTKFRKIESSRLSPE